jgi:uncharacterized protein YoxC|tara:strand:+ start:5041 stop:5214 length:174 start_codon:yes stop_codon:yes gene_type:complete
MEKKMKHIKNVEAVYDILVEVRKVFKALNGDTIVALNRMSALVTRIDRILEDNNEKQ